jgi:outer membrane immunogenic protein
MRATPVALIGAMSVAFATSATAGTPDSWEGFYAGVNVGYAWGSSDAVTTTDCGPSGPFYFRCGNQPGVQASGTGSLSPDGVTGGVQVGYNWQDQAWVYGGALDFGSFNLSKSRTGTSTYVVAAPGVPYATSSSVDTDWLFTARARLGWTAAPHLLLYATGGLALTNLEVSNAFADADGGTPGSGASSRSRTKAGWTIGGGVEWMLARNWTVDTEYLFLDFGSLATSAIVSAPGSPGANSTLTTSSDLTAHNVRLGVNYRY